jgi:hypothetical protein
VGHLHHFSKETALAALEDTGYRVIDHRYTSGRTELGGLGWKTRMLKLPRKSRARRRTPRLESWAAIRCWCWPSRHG